MKGSTKGVVMVHSQVTSLFRVVGDLIIYFSEYCTLVLKNNFFLVTPCPADQGWTNERVYDVQGKMGTWFSHTFSITCLLLLFGFSPTGIANTFAAHFVISWILGMFLASLSTTIFLALGRIVYVYRTDNSLVWYFQDHTPFFASVLSCGRIRMFISPPRNDPM